MAIIALCCTKCELAPSWVRYAEFGVIRVCSFSSCWIVLAVISLLVFAMPWIGRHVIALPSKFVPVYLASILYWRSPIFSLLYAGCLLLFPHKSPPLSLCLLWSHRRRPRPLEQRPQLRPLKLAMVASAFVLRNQTPTCSTKERRRSLSEHG